MKATLPRPSTKSAQTTTHSTGAGIYLAAILLAGFYLATSIYIASQRLFWFDELFTLHIARLANWATIWTALSHGVDALPPAYYIVVRVFDSLFGPGDVAARIPSAIALAAGLLLIFDCARRLTDGLHGLMALSVATCSFLPYYGYEARSYAIYFMLSALALWVWACTGASRRTAILFGAVFFVGGCFHYYFAMGLVPYVLWELLRWKPGLRPSAKAVAGIVGALAAVAIFSPLILSFSSKFSSGYWNRPSFTELRAMFPQLFPDGLFLLALIVLWIVVARSVDDKDSRSEAMSATEAVGWLFLAIPLAAFIVAELKTNAFYSRYFIGVLPGVAVAFAFLIWRHFHKVALISAGICLLLAMWGVGRQMTFVRHPELVEATGARQFLQVESSLHVEGKRYYVFSGPLLFLEAQYYAHHPERCVLLLPSDFSQQASPGPDPYLHQRLELNLAHFYPLQAWTVDDLRQHAGDAALIDPTQGALVDAQRAGLQPHQRFSNPVEVMYLQ